MVNTELKKVIGSTLEKSADFWNVFMDIPESFKHQDDNNKFRFHLHALQNIIHSIAYQNGIIKDA